MITVACMLRVHREHGKLSLGILVLSQSVRRGISEVRYETLRWRRPAFSVARCVPQWMRYREVPGTARIGAVPFGWQRVLCPWGSEAIGF